jgi:hypothetical protein
MALIQYRINRAAPADTVNCAVNLAWRHSLLHLIIESVWGDRISIEELV